MSSGHSSPKRRGATHAGTWYSASASALATQLEGWLEAARRDSRGGGGRKKMDSGEEEPTSPARAIIVPHAGYAYSGKCAAHAYAQVATDRIQRIILMGPSHHLYVRGCALTECASFETPFGDLPVDASALADFKLAAVAAGGGSGSSSSSSKSLFCTFKQADDEAEHSLEMTLPYLAYLFRGEPVKPKLIPLVFGDFDEVAGERYAELLKPYLADPCTLIVVSSDFCHWGSRFRYCYVHPDCSSSSSSSSVPLYEAIEYLDRLGMSIIEKLDTAAFLEYLCSHKNTICGRKPIEILLRTISQTTKQYGGDSCGRMKFLNYAQSSACVSPSDSSVSYAAASFIMEDA